jgi:hypothetical protein
LNAGLETATVRGIGSPARWKAASARRATLLAIKMELRKRLHESIAKTAAWVYSVIKGPLNYFAVSGHDARQPLVFAAAGYNFGLLLRWLARLLRALILKLLPAPRCQSKNA